MKNSITFFALRSSLRVSLQMLLGLLISLCYVNQGNAQDGVAWSSTNQLDPSNENYYVCTSEASIIFYIYPDEYCNVYDCSGNTQTTTLNNLLGYLNGTAITPMPYPTGGWYAWTYSLDPSTLTPGATYEVSFYPEYADGDCGWASTIGIGSLTYIHILTPNDVPSLTISSSTQLCPNTNITFTRDSNPYLSGNSPSFIWQKNGIDIVGQTGQTYTTNTLVAGDVITCEMTSSNTCLNTPTVDSNPLTINNPLTDSLSISSNPAASSSICPNTNIVFTATSINAGLNPGYYWYKNGTYISNTGSNSNTFTYPSNLLQTSDVISYTINMGNTCVTTSSSNNSLTFTNIQPKAQITFPTGVSSVCMNDSAQLSVNNVNGTSTYIWQKLQNNVATTIAGATASTYTTPPLTATTSYRYIRNNSLCGLDTSLISAITVNALPNITTNPTSANIVNGSSVTLNAYYNGTSCSWSPATGLNTTTGTTVIASPSTSTTYTVTVIDANGCSNTISLPITVSYSTDIAENTITDVSIFPNPADKNIRISMNTPFSQAISFCISDMLGKTLTQWEGKPENGVYENEISIENLSQGVYFLSVKIGERVMTQKFVKE